MGMSGGSVTGISGAGSGGAGYWIAADREMSVVTCQPSSSVLATVLAKATVTR